MFWATKLNKTGHIHYKSAKKIPANLIAGIFIGNKTDYFTATFLPLTM